MFRLSLRRLFQKFPPGPKRPEAAAAGLKSLRGSGLLTPGRCMGTHGRKEAKEPLNSPKRAKEFIYRLQPNERSCLLQELQNFESMARAQGEGGEHLTLLVFLNNMEFRFRVKERGGDFTPQGAEPTFEWKPAGCKNTWLTTPESHSASTPENSDSPERPQESTLCH